MSMRSRPEDPGATPPDPDDQGGSQPAGPAGDWTGGFPLEEILAAARRHFRYQAGRDVPAWGEPDTDGGRPDAAADPAAGDSEAGTEPSVGSAEPPPSTGETPDQRAAEGTSPQAGSAAGSPPGSAAGPPPGSAAGPSGASAAGSSSRSAEESAGLPDEEDPFGEDELRAAEQGTGQAVPLDDLAGHARLTPGPALARWLSCMDAAQLDDAALANSITAWRKVTSWAQARELAAVAELARRRGVALTPQPGRPLPEQLQANFAPNEIALALTLTGCSADYWMSLAVSLASRLPATLAALAGGTIDLARAKLIDQYTTVLDDDQARMVEARVLPKAERQTTGQLRAALLRAIIAVDPAAAERRRKEAERHSRVELTGEPDGTASLLGRFLPAAQASAAWTRIDIIANALQDSGAAGGIDLLRAQVLLRLLLGQPLSPPPADSPAGPDRPEPGPEPGPGPGPGPGPEPGPWPGPAGTDAPGSRLATARCEPPVAHHPWPGCTWPDLSSDGALTGLGRALGRALRRRAILTVPWRTLAGLIEEPGQLGRIGPVTASVARELARAAAADATCEWRILVADARGHPVAVTTIRPPPPRRHWPGTESPPGRGPLGRIMLIVPASLLTQRPATSAAADHGPQTDAAAADHGLKTDAAAASAPGVDSLARTLSAALRAARTAVKRAAKPAGGSGRARAPCSHARSVPGYRVPASMRALLEARDQYCGFPLCRRPAAACDMDHTTPYDQGGLTCLCNLYPECRRHHQLKGLRTWRVSQPSPGRLVWRTPAGLTYRTGPSAHPW